jgi:hypothetical protein
MVTDTLAVASYGLQRTEEWTSRDETRSIKTGELKKCEACEAGHASFPRNSQQKKPTEVGFLS